MKTEVALDWLTEAWEKSLAKTRRNVARIGEVSACQPEWRLPAGAAALVDGRLLAGHAVAFVQRQRGGGA